MLSPQQKKDCSVIILHILRYPKMIDLCDTTSPVRNGNYRNWKGTLQGHWGDKFTSISHGCTKKKKKYCRANLLIARSYLWLFIGCPISRTRSGKHKLLWCHSCNERERLKWVKNNRLHLIPCTNRFTS